MAGRTCRCGEIFAPKPTHPHQKWCTRGCKNKYAHRDRRLKRFLSGPQQRKCHHCGETFTVTQRNQQKRWCSQRCYMTDYRAGQQPPVRKPARPWVGSDEWAAEMLKTIR